MNLPQLPNSNDTRHINAALHTWFLNSGEITVIASDFPVNNPPKPMPETLQTFTLVEVVGVSPDLAKAIQRVLGERVVPLCGQFSYGWGSCNLHLISLAKRENEEAYRVMFPLYYFEQSSADLIQTFEKSQQHGKVYEDLGLDRSQLNITTFRYVLRSGWTTVE
ncbi:MAG: hypothetical protein COA78_36455 [Blastopirellula sp.]|nr:MAG: hypothetical protein COA78_36455 [Blastopirellula sp.]